MGASPPNDSFASWLVEESPNARTGDDVAGAGDDPKAVSGNMDSIIGNSKYSESCSCDILKTFSEPSVFISNT